MAVPDTPLIFFVVLFFWLYRRFINRMNLINTILIEYMALLMYTKYHGVLAINFTGLSNPRLLKKPQPYLAIFIALVLFFRIFTGNI